MNMKKQIVIIDYGHSAVDPTNGKMSPDGSFKEWVFNRKLGRKICNRLRGQGIDVREIVTEHEDNAKITPSARAKRVNAICDKEGTANCLFVSIHSNAAGNGTAWMNARGWSVFIAKNASSESKKLADSVYDAVALEGFKMRKPLPNQKYWQENFTVVYKTKCKAILTENLFYDNKEDLALLNDDTIIQKLLDAHVRGILNYMGMEPVELGPECDCKCHN